MRAAFPAAARAAALAAFAALGATACFDMSGASCECGPGCDQCSATFFDQTTPQFHVRDLSCGENDPNFPLYDPLHKLYHLFYQDHLSEHQGGDGQGPDIGHAVSADLVHWAHLPVAVWNDQPYDSVAIYTGSASVVNGVPTMIYPGLCTKHNWTSCDTGTLLALAVPADHAGDPLLTNWSKPAFNPIVNNTQRDPSSAWQTAAGEWRLTNFEGKIYSSMDFVTWAAADGGAELFAQAECPDFFPVPRACDGNGCAGPAPPGSVSPTHVHKESSSQQDWYTLGVYTDGAIGSTGNWTDIPGVPHLQPLDYSTGGTGMHYYASKSFYDPAGDAGAGRRIYWGWALVPPQSTQTLPRDTRWNAALQRLTFAPLPELAALRASPPLFSGAGVALAANETLWLGDWAAGAGNQSELAAVFALPASGPSLTFGLAVLVGAAAAGGNVSTPITFGFDPVAFTLNVTVGGTPPKPENLTYYMPGIDLPGGDYNVTDVSYTDPHICQAACTADGEKCQAWTYVTRPPLVGSCCLKGTVDAPDAAATCTSGSKQPNPHPTGGSGAFAVIPLLPGDTELDVRVYTDNTFIEVFVMQGRAAFTYGINVGAESAAAGMNLFASAPITASRVDAWHMNSIWVDVPTVLAAAAAKRDAPRTA